MSHSQAVGWGLQWKGSIVSTDSRLDLGQIPARGKDSGQEER